MNTIISPCPKCSKYPIVQTISNTITIKCNCRYEKTINIKEYVNEYGDLRRENDPFFAKKIEIKKGYEHINSYFKSIKDYHTTKLLSQIKEIESSYENSYNKNKSILTLLELLIQNYDGSEVMKHNILNTKLTIYNCNYSNNLNEVIKYFNEFTIKEDRKGYLNNDIRKESTFMLKSSKEKSIYDIKAFRIIKDTTKSINSLILLRDRKIASASVDNSLRIYNPYNYYHCDKEVQRHTQNILSICELEDGTIASCSSDKSIMIGDYLILNAHDNEIQKIITLSNNRFASCSRDNKIKIWKGTPPYNSTPIKVLEGHTNYIISILYVKEKDLLVSASTDKTLRLWSISTYQCISIITDISICWINALYQIDSERVIVGAKDRFFIVNIEKRIIENKIFIEGAGCFSSFLKLRDNKTVICGCNKGKLIYYNTETRFTITKSTNNEQLILDILGINDETFITCYWDGTITVWNY